MNKKLIALAVAAAFAAPAAMAQVVLYGKVHMDIVGTDDNANTQNVTVNSNASYLGFKGSEDLGDGLKAIFKYETTYSGTDSNVSIGDPRNSYVGLAGDFGTLLVGRHDTPAKSAFYAAGNDHLGDSIIDLNRMGFVERRVDDAVAYISPNMSGLKLAAMTMAGEQSGADDRVDENGLVDSFSLGVMYKGHGLQAAVGYDKIADTNDREINNDTTTLNAGASYSISGLTVGAQYAKHDDVGHVDGTETDVWAVSGKFEFDNNAIIANYGEIETETATSIITEDTKHTGIGFEHTMSNRTSVYVAFSNEDADNGVDTDRLAVGMVHNF